MSTMRDDQVTAIAEAFSEVMRQWLSRDEFAEMKRLNETDPDYANGACASHNYCDANMAMMEAFDHVMGHNMIPTDADGEISEQDTAIWNEAWELARKLYLGSQR